MLVKNPKIATMRMIQSQYKKLFDQVKSTKEPLFLIKGSETQVVVLDMETYKQCVKKRGSINKKVSNKQSKSDRAGYLKNLAGIAKGKYGDPVQFQKEIRKEDIN